jgi:DNA-binding FadR family transcriptional regulator
MARSPEQTGSSAADDAPASAPTGTPVSAPAEAMPMMPDLGITRVSVVERAIELLRAQIKNGVWKVGDRLPPEGDLTRHLGISRPPLREAIQALVHGGLLVTRQGAGTYVVAVDETAVALNRKLRASDIVHVLEVRRGLDVEAVRLACRRRTSADLNSMERALKSRRRGAEAGDQHGFAEADVAFHLAVAAAARNELLLELYESLSLAIRQSVDSSVSVAHAATDGEDDHEILLAAIRDRDEARAIETMVSILEEQLHELPRDRTS